MQQQQQKAWEEVAQNKSTEETFRNMINNIEKVCFPKDLSEP